MPLKERIVPILQNMKMKSAERCSPRECLLYLSHHPLHGGGGKGVRIQQEEFEAEILIERLGLAVILNVVPRAVASSSPGTLPER